MYTSTISGTVLFLSIFQIILTFPTDDPYTTNANRFKRIVIGEQFLINPPKPLPIGNLSTPQGDAMCYFVSQHYYCISQFLATYDQALTYCQGEKMNLLYLEEEEDHEYLYNFLSASFISKARKFLQRSDFKNYENYSNYVRENISPGLLVRCRSVCGSIRAGVDEGRVLDYEERNFVGLAVKVQWRSRIVRWYPGGNLEIRGFPSDAETANRKKPSNQTTSALFIINPSAIFEVGDKVRVKLSSPANDKTIWQGVPPQEVGVVTDLDPSGEACLAHFPSNRGWRGLLDHLEIVDKRKASGTYWTGGRNHPKRGWMWAGTNISMTFSNWGPGEPRDVRSPTTGAAEERCVEVKYHKGAQWFVARCSDRNNFICKK